MPLSNQLPFDFVLHYEFTFENFVVAEKNQELITLLQSAYLTENFYLIWEAVEVVRVICFRQAAPSI